MYLYPNYLMKIQCPLRHIIKNILWLVWLAACYINLF